AGAEWDSFTSTNLTINLGTTDGLYTVWVGLRGRQVTSQQTWERMLIHRDTVGPALTITSPVPGSTTSKPFIQVLGQADERVGIYYDISNAIVVITNQQGFVKDSYYDTNRLEFTTNYFQCYDLELTNGTNNITVRVSDLAGNVTTTNFNVTLDYTGDTTA